MRHRLFSSRVFFITFLTLIGALLVYLSSTFLFSPSSPPPPQLSVYTPPPSEPKEEGPCQKILTIGQGDTLANLLSNLNIPAAQVHEAIKALSELFNPKELRADQKVYITYQKCPDLKNNSLLSFSFQPEFEYQISVEAAQEGFKAHKIKKSLKHEHLVINGVIRISLYADALRAGASPRMLYEMIKAFSYDIDFQRDILPGTEFSLFYDTYKDLETGLERPGKLLYAKLVVQAVPYKIYYFEPKGGTPAYYTAKGEGVKKGLLRTPIDGARLSSGFGTRKHPIKGYTKMHKGVDFAAPKGTPIMAAGDGVVERSNRFGGYGNYICIRHTSTTKTAYAHLSCYAKGIRPGKKVRQGQVIGYVGTTGQSTGPHLHFELIHKGKHVNPQKATQLPTSKLAGRILKDFKMFMEKIDKMIREREKVFRSA